MTNKEIVNAANDLLIRLDQTTDIVRIGKL